MQVSLLISAAGYNSNELSLCNNCCVEYPGCTPVRDVSRTEAIASGCTADPYTIPYATRTMSIKL